jgi:hypothetical protein
MKSLQSAFEFLFEQSELVQLAVFLVHGLLVYGLSMAFVLFLNRRADVARWTPVGPYFASISVIFALFLAFHGSSIWSNKTQAERAFIDAGSAVKRLDEMLSPEQLDLALPRSSLQRYVRYVFRDEWRKARNGRASERAEFAFRELQKRIGAAAAQLPSFTASQLNGLLNDVARTRAARLWVGGNHTEAISWMAVFLLGLLTHLAVASIHFDKPRAGAIALGLLAATTTVAYWSLGIVDNPYRLMDHLNPAAWLPAVG